MGATKTTAVTAMAGGTNNDQLKAIRGSGRNGGGGGSGDGGNGNRNSNSNGNKYRKIKCSLLHFTPSSPPTLPSLCPCSHVSHLPQLVFVLPLVLCHLSFLSRHRLPSSGASIYPPIVVLPPLVMPFFFSGAHASHPPQLFVVSPHIMPPPPDRLYLCLSLNHHLSLRPSCISCPAGCHVASHYIDASCLPAPPTLFALSPLVAPLSCLLSTLAGYHVPSDVVQNELRSCRHQK